MRMKIEINVNPARRRLIANPASSPNKSLPHPISHGPNTPPMPAKVKSTPSKVLIFSVFESETAAVIVGKIMDRKKPVNGRKKSAVPGINRPMAMQINPPSDAKQMERK